MKSLTPTTEEEQRLAKSPRGLRKLILRNARHNTLTQVADAQTVGMTELDKYSTLAYLALRKIEALELMLNMAHKRLPITMCSGAAVRTVEDLAAAVKKCGPAKKYVLFPGYVRSRNDGDRHYIDAPKLAQLYGVRLGECVIANERGHSALLGLIELHPRSDGLYTSPED